MSWVSRVVRPSSALSVSLDFARVETHHLIIHTFCSDAEPAHICLRSIILPAAAYETLHSPIRISPLSALFPRASAGATQLWVHEAITRLRSLFVQAYADPSIISCMEEKASSRCHSFLLLRKRLGSYTPRPVVLEQVRTILNFLRILVVQPPI